MPRRHRKRDVRRGAFYHVFTRGKHWKRIVVDDGDRAELISRFSAPLARSGKTRNGVHGIQIAAYALMDNHFHLVLRSIGEKTELATYTRSLLGGYARYFNDRHNQTGPLFDPNHYGDRRIKDGADLVGMIAYTHLNPRTRQLRSAHTSDPYYRQTQPTPWWLTTEVPKALLEAAGGYEKYIAGTEWMRTARNAASRYGIN